MKKIKKLINNNKMNVLLITISFIAFITGGIAIGWIKSFIVIGLIDFFLFGWPVVTKKIKKTNKKTTSSNKKTTNYKNGTKKNNSHKKTKSNTKNSSKTTSPKKGSIKKKKTLKIILIVIFSIGIVSLLAGFLFFFMIAKNAPNFDPDKLYKKESTILYDSEGKIIAKLGIEKREKISYDDLPEVLIDAIIATEDSRFFQHNGFDLPRFLKASFGQVTGASGAGGASTITMQLVKNSFTSTIDSGWEGIKRKFTDIYMSIFKVEKSYTKKEILEFYVNSYYLGSGAHGVEQAAITYFGKSAKDLNLAEASLIAGLFQAPNTYSPLNDVEAATKRRKTVLNLMERHGYITKEEKDIANAITIESLLTEKKGTGQEYMDFIDTVVEEVKLKTKHNPYTVPMEIYTTMDRKQQDHVNKIMSGETFKWENDVVDAGVSVVNTQTGAITAIGAGRHRTGEGTFNNATMIKKQIGSSAKPLYDYGPGIEYNNWSTFTPWTDEPYNYNDTKKTEVFNWDGGYEGWMTSRYALTYSRNIPALKAFQKVKNNNTYKFVTTLGLSPELDGTFIHEAHALGGYNGENPLSMAAAYAAFANEGYYIQPYSFTKIVYRESDEVYEHKYVETKAMSEETAYMVNDMLVSTAGYALFQFGNVNGYKYAAKTGTTNFTEDDKKKFNLPYNAINDLWVIGMTDEYSIGVWYGYDRINKDYVSKFGNAYHSAVFQAVAKGTFTRSTNIKKPNNVVSVEVERGWMEAYLPSKYTPANLRVTELFKKGTEPTIVSKRFSQLDNVINLDGKKENGNTVKLTWDPIKEPDAINETYLKGIFNKMFTKPAYQESNLKARIDWNTKYMGDIVYDIYVLGSNGELQLLGTTNETSASIPIYSTKEPITYVVKSAYSIFKSNASSGSSITVNFDGQSSIIYSQLNGDPNASVPVNTFYNDPGVTVYENGVVVTPSSSSKTYRNTDTDKEIDSIDFSKPGNYTITYRVTFSDYTKTHVRTLKVVG
ncbi:MAG: transglycosylase domain-containing protein [Bacilli bacterium]|nr:transglycosylase domain-containing protein [Bacilli bacterium]MDD4808602.1 transglycosylase domain-containing protein [Bacilli bacterium]